MNEANIEPLGVGKLIGDTFRLVFTTGWWLTPVAMVLTIPTTLFTGYLWADVFSNPPQFKSATTAYTWLLAPAVIQLIAYFLTSALIIFAAYDAVLGKDIRLGHYFGRAIRHFLPIILLTVLTSVLMGLGLALFLVPGLYVAGCFYVLVPAILIDGAGFGGMGRSLDLTRGYRWPIVGLLLVFLLLVGGSYALIDLLLGLSPDPMDLFAFSLSDTLLNGIVNSLYYALGSVVVALTYARLREIKEGVGMEDLAEVFR